MSHPLASRPTHGPLAELVRMVDALARETHEAFEALARRQYDAPWQRIPTPRDAALRDRA